MALAISEIAMDAGAGISGIYESGDFGVVTKPDDSPLTRADMLSHDLIASRLAKLTPDIPVISEEGMSVDYALRSGWRRFYLVDPLDGTKSFIKRSGEFTVNIALVEDGLPVLGVIYAPVSGALYYSVNGGGAFRVERQGEPVRIEVSKPRELGSLVAVISRSHKASEQEAFNAAGTVSDFIPSGSSLKFCLVAEGRADIYPRFGSLWEWDTAAGHAILREAGGRVVDLTGSSEISYNKESMLQRGLLALPQWLLRELGPHMGNIKIPDRRKDA